MTKIQLALPWPPSVNHYKKAGGVYKTKNGKLYQPRINTLETTNYFYEVWVSVKQMNATQGLKSFDSATIVVEIDAYPPDNRKRDLDNICKVLLDSMVHAKLFNDDSQIARLTVERFGIIPKGQVIVRIYEFDKDHK